MTQRYDAVAIRKYEKDGEERSAFTNIGVAWPMKERDGYSLRLHCLPAPEDGEYVILLFPPKPKEDQQDNRRDDRQQRQQSYGQQPGGGYGGGRDLDDEIPFAPEWRV